MRSEPRRDVVEPSREETRQASWRSRRRMAGVMADGGPVEGLMDGGGGAGGWRVGVAGE